MDSLFAKSRRTCFWRSLVTAIVLLLPAVSHAEDQVSHQADTPGAVRYVIHVSVDGLRPDAITRHSPDELPNFYRLRTEGAFTDNARTDVEFGNTMPNHVAQLTGRTVLGADGHGWTSNRDPESGETIHDRKGGYVTSVFDVVHDAGLRTSAFVSKSKFSLLERSYDVISGAPDITGADDGRDKIDTFVYHEDTRGLVDAYIDDMRAAPYAYTFLHLRDPDTRGHAWGWRLWKWHPYMRSVRDVDALLGDLFELIDNDPRLADRTAIILTSDHGGSGHSHGPNAREHYTVPFYVWGPSVPNEDLYALNDGFLADPGAGQPRIDAYLQPVRNGMAGNTALALLGLDPIPGSTIALNPILPDSHLVEGSESSARPDRVQSD